MLFQKKIVWYKLFESITAANQMLPIGKVTTMQIANKKLCIAHTTENFFAINDKCPHNGASLGNGYCTSEGSVVCPVHRYHFDLKTGRAKSGLGDFVETYPVETRADGVFVGIHKTVFDLF